MSLQSKSMNEPCQNISGEVHYPRAPAPRHGIPNSSCNHCEQQASRLPTSKVYKRRMRNAKLEGQCQPITKSNKSVHVNLIIIVLQWANLKRMHIQLPTTYCGLLGVGLKREPWAAEGHVLGLFCSIGMYYAEAFLRPATCRRLTPHCTAELLMESVMKWK